MLAATSTKNIHLAPTVEYFFFAIIFFSQNFSKVIWLLDLPKLRPELIPGLANPNVAPFMSIKLGSE